MILTVAVLAEKLAIRYGRKTLIDFKLPKTMKDIAKREGRTIQSQGWGRTVGQLKVKLRQNCFAYLFVLI